jgi:hypothetical protein
VTTEKKILWTVGGVIGAVLLFFALLPSAKEGLAPELVGAHVAVLPAGAEAAVVGPVEIDAGDEFTLYAVLEARDRGGEPVYYTEAPALVIGGERAPDGALRLWDRPRVLKLFWFTVEGFSPYVKLEAAEQLDRFYFTEFFRPEWPSSWSVQGRLAPKFSEALARDTRAEEDRSFGTQRYQVRIELFPDEDALTAEERYLSMGADALPDAVDGFPTVYAALPGAAGPASLAFGLTQIEPPDGADSELIARLATLARQRLAFSRVPLIRQVIRSGGRDGSETRGELSWGSVDLASGPAWGDEGDGISSSGPAGPVRMGDLVRAGARVVVLYRDHRERGTPGRLDREDLCFDYERGASVRSLSEVFTGEGLVDVARL